jgi:hypothetical protein
MGLLKPNREAHKILYRKTRPSSMKTEEGRGGQKKQCKRFIPFALVKLIPKHTDNNQQIARAFPWTQLGAATREASQLIHGFLSLPMYSPCLPPFVQFLQEKPSLFAQATWVLFFSLTLSVPKGQSNGFWFEHWQKTSRGGSSIPFLIMVTVKVSVFFLFVEFYWYFWLWVGWWCN